MSLMSDNPASSVTQRSCVIAHINAGLSLSVWSKQEFEMHRNIFISRDRRPTCLFVFKASTNPGFYMNVRRISSNFKVKLLTDKGLANCHL